MQADIACGSGDRHIQSVQTVEEFIVVSVVCFECLRLRLELIGDRLEDGICQASEETALLLLLSWNLR